MDPPDVEADEVTESWIHVELGPPRDRVTADQLAADLRHVLDDVRVAVEDQERMAAVADLLADDLDGEPGSDEAEYGELLRWLADGNFLFLGYRQYDLVPTDEGTGLRAVPGTGLGILRHHRKGRAPLMKLSPEVAARAQDPSERLVLAKANSRSTVYRANYLDYVLGQEARPGRDGHRGVQVPRPVHAFGAHRAHRRHPGPAAQAGPGPDHRRAVEGKP